MPLLSWITGWINVSGWIALTASGGLLGSQFVVGVIALYNEVGDLSTLFVSVLIVFRTMRLSVGSNFSSTLVTTL